MFEGLKQEWCCSLERFAKNAIVNKNKLRFANTMPTRWSNVCHKSSKQCCEFWIPIDLASSNPCGIIKQKGWRFETTWHCSMLRTGLSKSTQMILLPKIHRKCFNHGHVQKRGFTKFSVFLKRVSLLNPRVRTNFVAFPIERTRKEPRSSLRVWPRPGFSKQLCGSGREGTESDRTYFKQFPTRGRVNREVQTVNWEADKKNGLSRQVSRAAWKRRINSELEAKKGPQTVN